MIFLATLKAKLIAALGGIVALGLAVLYIFNKGRKSKSDEINAETAKEIIETVKQVKKNEERVNDLSDDALDNELLNDARNPD